VVRAWPFYSERGFASQARLWVTRDNCAWGVDHMCACGLINRRRRARLFPPPFSWPALILPGAPRSLSQSAALRTQGRPWMCAGPHHLS